MRFSPLLLLALLPATLGGATNDLTRSRLGTQPDDTILRADLDGDGKPDTLERWWNGKRVRWLDENRDLLPDDTRGDLTGDTLQVDLDNDGRFDSDADIHIRWVDRDGDGVADLQVFAHNAPWKPGRQNSRWPGGHWMLFLNPDVRGVLGWMDWAAFDFDCWGYSGACNWLPNYHHGDFLKIHAPPHALRDPRLNWENPFSFLDLDGDGAPEMNFRWCAPFNPSPDGFMDISNRYHEAYVTFDLDNDSGRGNEVDYDFTLYATGGLTSFPYDGWTHPLPGHRGDPRFDPCFGHNEWRRVESVAFIPRDQQWNAFFTNGMTGMWFVYDEDDDDHRWERVEMLYPVDRETGRPADPWSLLRWPKSRGPGADTNAPSGLCGHRQSDSLGDRGEFDEDNSGGGKLYIAPFDRKLHLHGAEWGAWTVDREAKFHGGWKTPSPTPAATRVQEVVRYTDTDRNGFLDRVEFDYDGDRTIDLVVNLLDWKSDANPAPDAGEILDTHALGWRGLHDRFRTLAEQSWQEALLFHRAAWRRGLCDTETDRLACATTPEEKHQHAYWLKETLLRRARARLADSSVPDRRDVESALLKSAYLGDWKQAAQLLARVPGR